MVWIAIKIWLKLPWFESASPADTWWSNSAFYTLGLLCDSDSKLMIYFNILLYFITEVLLHYLKPKHYIIVVSSFLGTTTIKKFQGNSLAGDVEHTGKKICNFDWNFCLFWKQYKIGRWLLGITNSKSLIANHSLSVPTTSSDLERQDAVGQTVLVDLCHYILMVWPRMTKFGKVT